MSNPLLQPYDLPPFSSIRAEHVKPAIEQVLADSRARLASLLDSPPQKWTWTNLIEPLDDMGEQVSRAWSPVSHLNAVMNTPELRDAYNSCLPLLSEFNTEMGQNQKLFEAYSQLADSDDFATLDQAQQTIIGHALRDFRLSGIALPAAQQKRYGEMKLRLSDLQSRFSNQVMDATQAWSRHITDATLLDGLPESAMALARQAAEAKELDGWLINLEFPSYFAVMTYAHDRALREEVYTAYSTRASDQGPHAGENDNGPLIDEILELRQELAELLGYANYAELSLATKMAESTDQVVGFLRDLGQRSRSFAEQDLQALRDFAAQNGCPDLQSWDMGYYSEQLRQHCYAISQEELKPYFPIDRVLQGMFGVVEKLYGIQLRETQDFDRWHPDVRLFEVVEQGQVTGQFFLDLYARSHKRGGAWMDGCRDRRRLPGGALQRPIAYLVCNFTPPVATAAVGGKPALLTHDEVTTLFHEFGHGVHHLLTQVDYPSASGINGVAWDAVELPSQFMENWCWEPEGLALISGHFETHAPLPRDLLDKMLAARNFQSGLGMLRQVEFSLFDFLLHRRDYPALSVQQVLDKVRDEVAVFRPPAFNRFQNGFSHVFAGGYAAGYYSYKWAEVLSADAFSRFEEEGVLNADTGRAFRENILARGGSREPMELFVAFRGREPSIDALLRHSGLTGEAA